MIVSGEQGRDSAFCVHQCHVFLSAKVAYLLSKFGKYQLAQRKKCNLTLALFWGFPGGSAVQSLPAMQEK